MKKTIIFSLIIIMLIHVHSVYAFSNNLFDEITLEHNPSYIVSFYDDIMKNDNEVTNYTRNNIDGFIALLGMILGEVAGKKDFNEEKPFGYMSIIPKNEDIISLLGLERLTSKEKTYFTNIFKEFYKLGYENTYYSSRYENKKKDIESGKIHGKYFGEVIGSIYGSMDYLENRTLDYSRHMLTDSKIKSEYSLNDDSEEYIIGFIDSFKDAYIKSYINSFRETRNYIKKIETSLAYENGYNVGMIKGAEQATIDYYNGKINDWTSSKPSMSFVIYNYKLMYHGYNYIENFISGYWEGYRLGYFETYTNLSQEEVINKVAIYKISQEGGVFKSKDEHLSVEIEKGTYYKEKLLYIEVMNNPNNVDNRFINISNAYKIKIINQNFEFDENKKVKISFDYYGDYKGGIYILKENYWEPLISEIKDNKITTTINPSILNENGSIFTVLIDTKFNNFYDIRGHWAKAEIENLVRKGIINGYPDGTFKPENKITRAEFLVLLSKAFKWDLPNDINNLSVFKDSSNFNIYNSREISYALGKGYVSGYSDNYFRPYNYITYKEVETIMKRILENDSFTWESIAKKIIYDKKVRSKSFDSMDNHITRAEVAYLLYDLTK